MPMRVVLKAYIDRSFTFVVKPPPTTWFIKKAAGLEKGSFKPGHESAGRISVKWLYEIAKIKQKADPMLVEHDPEGICRMLVGTCKSMGIDVVEDTLTPTPVNIQYV